MSAATRAPARAPAPQESEVVRWTASLGALTASALAVAHDTTPARARARLRAACDAGLLTAVRPLLRGPTLYTATAAGRRLAGSELEPCRVTTANATHLIAVAEVAAAMAGRHPDHAVEGERDLRAREREAGHPLASARLGMAPDGSPRLHRPDLVLWPADVAQLPVAVEVELTVKAPRRLAAIVLAWARCRRVAGTLYCADPGAERAVRRAVAAARAEERVLVIPRQAVTQLHQNRPAPAESH